MTTRIGIWTLLIISSFFMQSQSGFAQPKLALINNQVQEFKNFDLAAEAVQKEARVIIFPEWGYREQEETPLEILSTWEKFAQDKVVYVFLNARYQQSNATFVYGPSGKITHYFRRDGHHTPERPNEPSQVIQTQYGRFGVLSCDEIFIPDLVNQYRKLNIDAVINPAQTNVGHNSASLGQQLLIEMNEPADVYTTDQYQFYADGVGKFDSKTHLLTRNMFGVDRPLDHSSDPDCTTFDLTCLFWKGSKVHGGKDHYYISYHDLSAYSFRTARADGVELHSVPQNIDWSAKYTRQAN